MPHFVELKIYSCGKHCVKRRNCLLQAISPFLTMFSILYGTYFSFEMHFKMLSAICFNLDHSKILLSGNGLNPILLFATMHLLAHCRARSACRYMQSDLTMHSLLLCQQNSICFIIQQTEIYFV